MYWLPQGVALGRALRARGLNLACAESCTGGLVSARCTAVAGSSQWLLGGWVVYSNTMKLQLGVRPQTLQEHGAVSEAVVRELADAARRTAQSSIALAISGVAGPGGGSVSKPVGQVWIAWSTATCCTARCYQFDGDREQVRHRAAMSALSGVFSLLGGAEKRSLSSR